MTDVLIVGAGIIGAACAFELSREGLRVHVLDASSGGDGTTAAGMGHVLVLDGSETELAFTRFSRRLWDELAVELPATAEREVCGTLWIAEDEAEMDAARARAELLGAHEVETELLGARALREAEPELREGLPGALRVPGDSVVYPPAVVDWWLDQARQRGATVDLGVEVAGIGSDAVVLADGSRLCAEWLVNAAGHRAFDLLDEKPAVPIVPRKGHLAITDRYPGFCRHQLVELGYVKSAHGRATESVAFNVQPRATGQVLIGSSRQLGTTDRGVEMDLLGRMLRRAVDFLPRLKDLRILRTWTGFRAATPDKLPLIGPSPGRPDVLLATGHEGLGITTSLGTARLITDIVLGRPSEIDREPLRADRSSVP